MTPEEVLAMLRLVARLQQQINVLEAALAQAQQQVAPKPPKAEP